MFNTVKSLFNFNAHANKRSARANRSRMNKHRASLSVEPLEGRLALSGTLATLGTVTTQPQPGGYFKFYDVPSSITAGQNFTVKIEELSSSNGQVIPTNGVAGIYEDFGNSYTPELLALVTLSGGVGTANVTIDNTGPVTLEAIYGTTFQNHIVTGYSNSVTVEAPVNNDNNWAGYQITPGSGVTAVGGTWVVPTVTGAAGQECCIWVGIDGAYPDTTVEQIGVWATVSKGATVYTPWLEFAGDDNPAKGFNSQGVPNARGAYYYETPLTSFKGYSNFTVNPGDTISAEVSVVAGTKPTFLFQMTDQPQGGGAVENFSMPLAMQYATPLDSSAEWIVENPNETANGPAQPLANFGHVTFTGAWATVDGTTGSINSFANATCLNMSAGTGNASTTDPPVASNGVLGWNEPSAGWTGSSFTVTYVSATAGSLSTTGPMIATGHLYGLTDAVDAVFAQDAMDSVLNSGWLM
jgi:Peptidase A4 family